MEPSMMLDLQQMSQTPSLWEIESPRSNKTIALISKRTGAVNEGKQNIKDVNNQKNAQFSKYDLSEVVVMQRVEIERLIREREKNNGVIKSLEGKNNELQTERSRNLEMDKKLFQLQAINKDLKAQFCQKNQQIAVLNFKLQNANLELQKNCIQMQKLQKQTFDLTQSLAQQSTKTERMSGQQVLKKTLRELQIEKLSSRGQSIQIMELEGIAKQWALKYSKLEKQLYEKQERLQRLSGMQRNLEDHQIEVEKLGMIAKAKIYEVTELNSQTLKLKSMYDQEGKKYELQVQQANYQIENLAQQKDDLSKKLTNRQQQIAELCLDNNEMAKRISRYELDEAERTRMMQQKDMIINQISNRGQQLTSKNRMLQQKIRTAEEEMEQLRYEIQKLKQSASQSKQSIADLQSRVDEKSEFVNKLHLDVVSLHKNALIEEEKAKQFDKMINMNKRLTQNIAELQQNVYDLEHTIVQKSQQLNSAHIENSQLKDECEMLKKLSQIENKELNCLKEQRQTCLQEIWRLKKFEALFAPMRQKIKELLLQLKQSHQHSKKTQNRNQELFNICISLRNKIMELHKNGCFPEEFRKAFWCIKTNFCEESQKIKDLLKKQQDIQKFVEQIQNLVVSVCEHIRIKNGEWMQVNGNLNDLSQNLKMLSSLQDENNILKLRLLNFESSQNMNNIVKHTNEEENDFKTSNSQSSWQSKFKREAHVDPIKQIFEPVKDQFKIGSRFVLATKTVNNHSYQNTETQPDTSHRLNITQNNKYQIQDNVDEYKMGRQVYFQEAKANPVRTPFVFKTSQRREV